MENQAKARLQACERGYEVQGTAEGAPRIAIRRRTGWAKAGHEGEFYLTCESDDWEDLDAQGLAALRDACCALLWNLDPQGAPWPPEQANEVDEDAIRLRRDALSRELCETMVCAALCQGARQIFHPSSDDIAQRRRTKCPWCKGPAVAVP